VQSFEHIDHDPLLAMLANWIDDQSLGLIRKWLKAGIMEADGQIVASGDGNPARGDSCSSYTTDTFSLSVSLSLCNHSIYSLGRKYAVYRWQRPAVDCVRLGLNPSVNKGGHNGKEKTSTTNLESSSRRSMRSLFQK
jgi:hypothetical protein